MARSMARTRAPTGRATKRDTHPDDLVGALPHIASSGSDIATGRTINIDGGVITWRGSKNA